MLRPELVLGVGGSMRAWAHRVAIAIIVFCVGMVSAQQIGYVAEKGDALSDFADNNSESNAIRAGESYARRGFTFNKGLPDIAYGKQFSQWGAKIDLDYCGRENGSYDVCVYQHYPPGPDWIVGFLSRVFGVGRAGYFRLFPLAFGIASLAFFAATLVRFLGPVRAAIVVYLLTKLPMLQNMMHGLHYQGYALSLLLLELSLGMRLFFRPEGQKLWLFVGLFLLGHVQGWMSFDYCFLVTFCLVPIWLMTPEWRSRTNLKHIFFAVFLAGMGFTLAHMLHFWQVMAFRGDGFHGLLEHFREVARARSATTNWDAELPFPGLFGLLVKYWTVQLPRDLYFGLNYTAWIAGILAFFLVPFSAIDVPLGRSMVLRVRARRTHLVAVIVAIGVSSLWIVLMRTHAFVHQHFIPRHYFLGYAIAVIALFQCVAFDVVVPEPEASREPA